MSDPKQTANELKRIANLVETGGITDKRKVIAEINTIISLLKTGASLSKAEKGVIDSFYMREHKTGKILYTDGNVLVKTGMGGKEVAKWVHGKIHVLLLQQEGPLDKKIITYLKKAVPENVLVQ